MSAAHADGGMSFIQRKVLQKIYTAAAGDPAKLPWHREEPEPILMRATEKRTKGRALDIGCGSGIFAEFLASKGLSVTAIDIQPEAIEMANELATKSAHKFQTQVADILSFDAKPFDLILDSGCLHNINDASLSKYKRRLLELLAPGGDFLLGHWDKRHAFDWRPIGPLRRSSEAIVQLFGPELSLVEKESEEIEVPFPIGPRVRGTGYWFRRLV